MVPPCFTQAVQRCSKDKKNIRPRLHATAGTRTKIKVEQTSSIKLNPDPCVQHQRASLSHEAL